MSGAAAERPKVYLAGPGVFYPDAAEHGATLKAICAGAGLEGLWPGDVTIDGPNKNLLSYAIFHHNIEAIRSSAAVIADVSPFRGPHLDCGTAWEIGFAHALGLPVFGYTSVSQQDRGGVRRQPTELIERIWCEQDRDKVWRDAHGFLVEDFGLWDNLMVAYAVRPQIAADVRVAIARCATFLRQGEAA